MFDGSTIHIVHTKPDYSTRCRVVLEIHALKTSILTSLSARAWFQNLRKDSMN